MSVLGQILLLPQNYMPIAQNGLNTLEPAQLDGLGQL